MPWSGSRRSRSASSAVIWLFLFGQLFRRVIDIPGFAFHGSYMAYLVPGLIAMNAMSNNMWAGMAMIEEIDRGTLNRFLVAPASRIGIMNAAEQPVGTIVQSTITGARWPQAPLPRRGRRGGGRGRPGREVFGALDAVGMTLPVQAITSASTRRRCSCGVHVAVQPHAGG